MGVLFGVDGHGHAMRRTAVEGRGLLCCAVMDSWGFLVASLNWRGKGGVSHLLFCPRTKEGLFGERCWGGSKPARERERMVWVWVFVLSVCLDG